MSSKRLCLFVPTLTGGGAERSFALLANGFAAKGYEVDLVLVRKTGPWLAEVGSDVRIVDLDAGRAATAILPLARYLKSARPRAVLSALDQANVAALIARALSGVRTRLVISIRLPIGRAARAHRSLRHRVTRMLARRLYRKADLIVAISDAVREDLIETFDFPPGKVVTAYNPIVDDRFWEKAKQPPAQPLPLEGARLIVAAGRLRPVKGFDTLIHAFAEVRRAHDVRLLILGEGPERERLERLAADLDIADEVMMQGFDPNPLPYMARASIFVSSSIWEGFGNSIVEAMALGVPTICTRTEGPEEILEGGKWGRLVPIGDAGSLAAAIADYLTGQAPDPRPRALEFSVERSVEAYLAAVVPDPTSDL